MVNRSKFGQIEVFGAVFGFFVRERRVPSKLIAVRPNLILWEMAEFSQQFSGKDMEIVHHTQLKVFCVSFDVSFGVRVSKVYKFSFFRYNLLYNLIFMFFRYLIYTFLKIMMVVS